MARETKVEIMVIYGDKDPRNATNRITFVVETGLFGSWKDKGRMKDTQGSETEFAGADAHNWDYVGVPSSHTWICLSNGGIRYFLQDFHPGRLYDWVGFGTKRNEHGEFLADLSWKVINFTEV